MKTDELKVGDAMMIEGSPDGWDHLTRVAPQRGWVAIESAEGLCVMMANQELPPAITVMRDGKKIHPEVRS